MLLGFGKASCNIFVLKTFIVEPVYENIHNTYSIPVLPTENALWCTFILKFHMIVAALAISSTGIYSISTVLLTAYQQTEYC